MVFSYSTTDVLIQLAQFCIVMKTAAYDTAIRKLAELKVHQLHPLPSCAAARAILEAGLPVLNVKYALQKTGWPDFEF